MTTYQQLRKEVEKLRRRSTAAEQGGGAERREHEHRAEKLAARDGQAVCTGVPLVIVA